jgi:hypothetical protein
MSLLCGCGKPTHEIVVDNMLKVIAHNSILTDTEYDKYISNLDDWATGLAYDELVVLPESMQTVQSEEEKEYLNDINVEVDVEAFNVYACFRDVDLEEFSDFYLMHSDEYLTNIEGGEGDGPSNSWDEKRSEWFNPDKVNEVSGAVCYVGYGYYNLIIGDLKYKYYIAVKCDKDGKVEEFIDNYLNSY